MIPVMKFVIVDLIKCSHWVYKYNYQFYVCRVKLTLSSDVKLHIAQRVSNSQLAHIVYIKFFLINIVLVISKSLHPLHHRLVWWASRNCDTCTLLSNIENIFVSSEWVLITQAALAVASAALKEKIGVSLFLLTRAQWRQYYFAGLLAGENVFSEISSVIEGMTANWYLQWQV